jgi:hypothetical protein
MTTFTDSTNLWPVCLACIREGEETHGYITVDVAGTLVCPRCQSATSLEFHFIAFGRNA